MPVGVVETFPADVFVQWTDPASGGRRAGLLGTLEEQVDDDIEFPVEHSDFGCPDGELQRIAAWAGPPVDQTRMVGCDEPSMPASPACVSPLENAFAKAEGEFPVESTPFEEWTKCGETGIVHFVLTLATPS